MVSRTIQLFLLCSFLALLYEFACADPLDDPPDELCSNTSNYTAGSPFENNLKNLFLSLSSNASVSKFYNTSIGNYPDRVYGLYMCFNYINGSDCQDCVLAASKDIVKFCPNRKEAFVGEELCQLRYSNENFFGQLNVTGNISKQNEQNIPEPELFKAVVNKVLSNLTKQAAFDSLANMYATGEAPFKDDTIYAVVQCGRDLSANNCSLCLQRAITDIQTCCYFSVGARLFSRSCYLRYELYNFYGLPSPRNNMNGKSNGRKTWIIIILTVVPVCLGVALLVSFVYCLAMNNKTKRRKNEIASRGPIFRSIGEQHNTDFQHQNFQGINDPRDQEFPYFDFAFISAATDNFSDSNKLGEGGFGTVYKGILSDGKQVAVKRLSGCSEQGSSEFTTEVLLIMKVQHKNLVRLLGFCIDREEKLLIYEYMPNSSLDVFLFDARRRAQLDWSTRLNIISGIARGMLYLHEDSRLRIIHRDLKPSNVLLDKEMNPKISDFGMARIIEGNEGEANTAKIVGTYGYMAPEYAMDGLYSIKSDVFSFGVLLLEIMTGRRNSGFHQSKHAPSLLAYAWKLWNEGKGLELIDPLLTSSSSPDEFLRYIHIGLLCIQEDAYYRPTMFSVVQMIKGQTVTLCRPERPTFFVGRFTDHYETNANNYSVNGLTISSVLPR
ncbi:cysteine-rich receptor-like protein kinase 10 isoform X1 [Fagus crenata]